MKHWQVTATMENGAQVLFGVKAGSDEEALDLAHERLLDAAEVQIVMEVDVEPLVPAAGR